MKKYNKEEMERLYWQENKSSLEIADILGITKQTVLRAMRHFGISRRSAYESRLLYYQEDKVFERLNTRWDKGELLRLYWGENKTTTEIGSILGHPASVIGRVMKKLNIPLRDTAEAAKLRNQQHPARRGPHNPCWRGGKRRAGGYIRIKLSLDDPFYEMAAASDGCVLEHRLVMAQKLGRYLLPSETVHHINGIKDDNRPENLKLVSRIDHQVHNELCANCPLRKEIRLLRWQFKQLQEQLQYKLME